VGSQWEERGQRKVPEGLVVWAAAGAAAERGAVLQKQTKITALAPASWASLDMFVWVRETGLWAWVTGLRARETVGFGLKQVDFQRLQWDTPAQPCPLRFASRQCTRRQ